MALFVLGKFGQNGTFWLWKVWEFHDNGQHVNCRREIKKSQGGQLIGDKRKIQNSFNLKLESSDCVCN